MSLVLTGGGTSAAATLAQLTVCGVLTSALAVTLPSIPITLTVYELELWLLTRTP